MVTVSWGHGISMPTSLSTRLRVSQLRLKLLKFAAHVELLTLAVRGGGMLKWSCRGKKKRADGSLLTATPRGPLDKTSACRHTCASASAKVLLD